MPMTTSVDFRIVGITEIPSLSLIYAQNEEAFNYLTDELDMAYLQDGSCPIDRSRVGDFISDTAFAHMCCSYE